ncbi:MAG: rod shape-determining protein MreD [Candidatus Omnitrophica bacterium]|nr:rod shape-determining protein MreD [Candidatus Omnitrophota bacterium]
MKRTIAVIFVTFLFFYTEYLLGGIFGKKYVPNLILLFIIFVDLTLGIRYGLFVAALGGIIKDSFGIHVLGFYFFSFTFSAYITTILERFIFQKGSRALLLFLVFLVCIINTLTQCILSTSFDQFSQFLTEIMIPETVSTLIVTPFLFKQLRKCVLKYFVL